jgi:hypothetical protein
MEELREKMLFEFSRQGSATDKADQQLAENHF